MSTTDNALDEGETTLGEMIEAELRDRIAAREAERDAALAEVERLRGNVEAYAWDALERLERMYLPPVAEGEDERTPHEVARDLGNELHRLRAEVAQLRATLDADAAEGRALLAGDLASLGFKLTPEHCIDCGGTGRCGLCEGFGTLTRIERTGAPR